MADSPDRDAGAAFEGGHDGPHKENPAPPQGITPEADEAVDEESEPRAGGGPATGPTRGSVAGAPLVQPKAGVFNRVVAKFIDVLVALLLAELPGRVGVIAGLTYIGVADGLMGGRSVGKRLIGLRTVMRKTGRPADFRASVLRNTTIGFLYLLYRIPLVGWAFAVFGLGFEMLLIIGSHEGLRLGDEIAGTVVAEEDGER